MKKYLLLYFTILFFNILSAQQSNITVKFNNTKDTIAMLGYYYGKEKYIEDTTQINNKGESVFSREYKYNGGMYFIALPQSNNIYFSLLIGDKQNFLIDVNVENNQFKNIKFTNSGLNDAFENFNNKMSKMNIKYQILGQQYKSTEQNSAKRKELKDSLLLLKQEREMFILQTYNNQKFKTLKTIIGLIIEPELPNFNTSKNVQNKDSLIQMREYYYYKNHYWDYVDFSDSIIIRTPFFIPKFEKYISEILIQHPDTLIKESIKIIEKSRGNIATFAFMINYMLVYNEKAKMMGMDKIFVEIGKKYYLRGKAFWADSAYTAKVIDKIYKTEPNLIGEKAPAINNVTTINDKVINMYDIDADYLVLVFWEPSCGHCKTELPSIYDVYNELITKGIDIEVFAMLGDKDTLKWKKFIKEKKINEWINVWDEHWQTNFKVFYDIYSTPTIYLLDKKKTIIAKRITSAQLKEFILKKEEK